MGVRWIDKSWWYAGLATLTLFTGGFCIGFGAMGAGAVQTPADPMGGSFSTSLLTILSHNLPASLLLLSGVVSMGLSSAIGAFLVATFVGATMQVAIGNAGVGRALLSIASYAPLEFAAFAVATVAGLLPTVAAITAETPAPFLARYRSRLTVSFHLALVCFALLVVGALIETSVIISRSQP